MGLLTTSMFVTNMLLWWTLDSVALRLVIKLKILKEGLQWRFERRVQVESYVVTSIKPNKRIEPLNLQCNILHSCKSERHFRPKDEAPSHGARHSRAGPPSFFVPLPNFVVSRKICLKHIIKTKIFSLKNAFSPQVNPKTKTENFGCKVT